MNTIKKKAPKTVIDINRVSESPDPRFTASLDGGTPVVISYREMPRGLVLLTTAADGNEVEITTGLWTDLTEFLTSVLPGAKYDCGFDDAFDYSHTIRFV